jgi:hypothetical protein
MTTGGNARGKSRERKKNYHWLNSTKAWMIAFVIFFWSVRYVFT